MLNMKRRNFIKAGGVVAAASLAGFPFISFGKSTGRVVIVGGGYGGATAAKYLRLADSNIEVTLIEPKTHYISCPMSNEVLAGERNISSITVSYQALNTNYGINLVHQMATEIDPVQKNVRTADGRNFPYDRLIVSPGVDFRWDAIAGYDESAVELMPHAWNAGNQTLLLRKQLVAMEDGGLVIIIAPPNPFKCPPGPYERASQIAHYLKQHKPKSKILILDQKDKFSKQGLFKQGWKQHYAGMIEWIPASQDGKVLAVHPDKMMIETDFEEHEGDVINVIPPQKAGKIAQMAGLTDKTGWCPVDQKTFESTIHKDVHIIGDASIAGKMPKSGYAASSQAKVCAAAVAALINGQTVAEPSYVNTCYSLITPNHGVSVSAIYQLNDEGNIVSVKGAGGLSPMDASAWEREQEANHAHSWIRNILSDSFG